MQFNHYLNFNGKAEAAFTFYQSIFGGEFSVLTRYDDLPPQEGIVLSDSQKSLILHVRCLSTNLQYSWALMSMSNFVVQQMPS